MPENTIWYFPLCCVIPLCFLSTRLYLPKRPKCMWFAIVDEDENFSSLFICCMSHFFTKKNPYACFPHVCVVVCG